MSRHWQLEHTADVGVEAEAESFQLLLGELALGMFEFIVDPRKVEPEREYEVGEIRGESPEAVVVNWLNELLFLHESRELVFNRFAVERLEPLAFAGKAWGEAVDPEKHSPIGAVKAATYHRLSTQEQGGVWRAKVYFDV